MTTNAHHDQHDETVTAPRTPDDKVFSSRGQHVFNFLKAGYGVLVVALIWVIGSLGVIPGLMGYTQLTVYTPSMEPTLPTGSLIWVDSTPQDYTVGDIVSYYPEPNDATLYTHRIVGVRSDGGFITKGDNNAVEDDPIQPEQIAGKVVKPIAAPIRGVYSIPSYINENKTLLIIGLVGLGAIGLFRHRIESSFIWRKP